MDLHSFPSAVAGGSVLDEFIVSLTSTAQKQIHAQRSGGSMSGRGCFARLY
jgi:hypothetical protein